MSAFHLSVRFDQAASIFQTPDFAANEVAHARRHFIDVVKNFPAERRYVLETLREVFYFDKLARQQGLTHQRHVWVFTSSTAVHLWNNCKWPVGRQREVPGNGPPPAIVVITPPLETS